MSTMTHVNLLRQIVATRNLSTRKSSGELVAAEISDILMMFKSNTEIDAIASKIVLMVHALDEKEKTNNAKFKIRPESDEIRALNFEIDNFYNALRSSEFITMTR